MEAQTRRMLKFFVFKLRIFQIASRVFLKQKPEVIENFFRIRTRVGQQLDGAIKQRYIADCAIDHRLRFVPSSTVLFGEFRLRAFGHDQRRRLLAYVAG